MQRGYSYFIYRHDLKLDTIALGVGRQKNLKIKSGNVESERRLMQMAEKLDGVGVKDKIYL